MTIREMTTEDHERVLAINELNAGDVGPLDAETLSALSDQAAFSLVAEKEHEGETIVIGFAIALLGESGYSSSVHDWFRSNLPDAIHIERIAFDIQYMGQGFGLQIYGTMDDTIDELRSNGKTITHVGSQVCVDPMNQHSLDFHESRGYAEVSTLTREDGVGISLRAKPLA